MGWSRVIIDLAVPIGRRHRPRRERRCSRRRRSWRRTPKWRTRIIDKPEVWGLESVSGDALVIRLVMKTRANAKDDVARELRMRVKHSIDELGLTLPPLNSIMPSGSRAPSACAARIRRRPSRPP